MWPKSLTDPFRRQTAPPKSWREPAPSTGAARAGLWTGTALNALGKDHGC